jgi:hypothetical protein
MDMMPRWRGLNHFKEVIKISFADGSKFEDLAKVNSLLFFLVIMPLIHYSLRWLYLLSIRLCQRQVEKASIYYTASAAMLFWTPIFLWKPTLLKLFKMVKLSFKTLLILYK